MKSSANSMSLGLLALIAPLLFSTKALADQDCLASAELDNRATVHQCTLVSGGQTKSFSVVGYNESFLIDGRSNAVANSVVFFGPQIYWLMVGSKVDVRAFDRTDALASAVQKACSPTGLSDTAVLRQSGASYIFPDDAQENSIAGIAEIHLLGKRELSFNFDDGSTSTLSCQRQ